MIYFIREGDNGPIKIGYSGAPKSRQRQLQTGNPRELRIIGIMPGDANVESKLHEQFALYRMREEWFDPVPEIIDFIRSHCTQGEVNTISLLDNGECRIVFHSPIQPSLGLLLAAGAYRRIKLLGDKKPEHFYGIEGPVEVLEMFLCESGISEQALQEFRGALSKSENDVRCSQE